MRGFHEGKTTTHQLDQEPIKSILLYGCKVTKTQKDRFELDSQGRTFFMCADTEQVTKRRHRVTVPAFLMIGP